MWLPTFLGGGGACGRSGCWSRAPGGGQLQGIFRIHPPWALIRAEENRTPEEVPFLLSGSQNWFLRGNLISGLFCAAHLAHSAPDEETAWGVARQGQHPGVWSRPLPLGNTLPPFWASVSPFLL